MAVYGGLKIEGGRELRRTLRKAGADMTELTDTNRAAAEVVVERARSWAPYRDGNLQRSLRTGATRTAGIARAGNNRRSASGVPYAAPIHWGWKKRGIRANPFLSYSAQATESTWIKLYEKRVNDLLSHVKGK